MSSDRSAAAEDPRFSPRFEEDGSLQPCRLCGQTPSRVQDYMYVMSFLLMTRHATYEDQLCRGCATRTALKEQVKSALLGWWGIPWGLLTLKAMWINTRALLRWSTVPAVVALLSAALVLAVPVGVAWLGWHSSEEEQVARQTGDWVDEEVVQQVEEGHRLFDQGELEQALESYRRAQQRAPGSSVTNFQVALLSYLLGRPEEALPFARRAEELAPDDVQNQALHGALLVMTGHLEEARLYAEKLRGVEPADVEMAFFLHEIASALGDDSELLRASDAWLALDPEAETPRFSELLALVRLDRVEEAQAYRASLPEEVAGREEYARLAAVVEFRAAPLERLPALLERWAAEGAPPAPPEMWVAAAERAGVLEEARSRVHAWLAQPATPGDAWLSAQPWFPEEAWRPALESYLATRSEPAPALLLLSLMDRRSERPAVLALARRAHATDHPLAAAVDGFYFRALEEQEGPEVARVELARHVAARPNHPPCLVALARLELEVDPERARETLAQAEAAGSEEPELTALLDLIRREVAIAGGRPEEALADAEESPARQSSLDDYLELLLAEAAFHAGHPQELDRHLAPFASGRPQGEDAPALLLAWMQQIASGDRLTYRGDVNRWLERDGEELRRSESATALGLLLVEERVDRAWVESSLGRRDAPTLELVALVAAIAEAGEQRPDLTPWEAFVARHPPGHFAVRLARTVLERRGYAEGAGRGA